MGTVELLSEEKSNMLAEQNGWSTSYANGYVAGEMLRRRNQTLEGYALIGIDEWAQGARAGYFGRQRRDTARVQSAGMR